MFVGVSTASLFLRRYNEDALVLLNELGVRHTEVFLTTFSEYGQPFADRLAAVKGDLNVHSVHVLNTQYEPQLFSKHERAREDAYGWLEKALCSAERLGARYYTFHGLARVKSATRSGANDDIPSWLPDFQKIVAACKRHGVTLCLENVEWASYNRPGVFAPIAEAIPELGGVLDVKQARISGYPYERYLEEMGERLRTVHLSDIDENGKMRLPGKGTFDFDTLVRRLSDVGFQGALLIEAYQGDYDRESELKTACDFLQELLYKHNCLSR